ncbi:unnamed protein product [Amoebophrya sp. A25]|nr:unnamed protein product [Amoebophrya sp. A25]|eukprot:GSA25T00020096001.1
MSASKKMSKVSVSAPRGGYSGIRGLLASYVGLPPAGDDAYCRSVSNRTLLPLVLVHLNIISYAFAYWITQPVLPYLSKSLGADAITFGYLQTVTSVMQILGGAAIGRYVDVYSPRFGMVVTTLGSAASYFFLGLSFHTAVLFLSRLPTCLQQCMQVAQSYVPKLLLFEQEQLVLKAKSTQSREIMDFSESLKESSAVLLGRLALSYGVGMVLGSLFGGFLAEQFGFHAVALLAFALSMAVAVMNVFCLGDVESTASAGATSGAGLGAKAADIKGTRGGTKRDGSSARSSSKPLRRSSSTSRAGRGRSVTPKRQTSSSGASTSGSVKKASTSKVKTSTGGTDVFGLRNYFHLLRDHDNLRAVLVYTTLLSVGFQVQQSSFSVAAIDKFDFPACEMGMVMSAYAAISIVVNTFLIKPPIRWLGEAKAVEYATFCIVFLLAVYANATTKVQVLLVLFPVSVLSAFIYTVITSLVSHHARTEEQGSAIALRHAVRSAVGIVAPPVAGYILQEIGFPATGFVASAFVALAVLAARKTLKDTGEISAKTK